MKRYVIWGLEGLLWFASLDGVLQLQRLPDAAFGQHSVCGPWGCGAPLPALLACHGFWAVLIAPAAVLAGMYLPAVWVRRLGFGLAAAGVCGLIAVVGWEAATWLPEVLPSQRHFFVQRCRFQLPTSPTCRSCKSSSPAAPCVWCLAPPCDRRKVHRSPSPIPGRSPAEHRLGIGCARFT